MLQLFTRRRREPEQIDASEADALEQYRIAVEGMRLDILIHEDDARRSRERHCHYVSIAHDERNPHERRRYYELADISSEQARAASRQAEAARQRLLHYAGASATLDYTER